MTENNKNNKQKGKSVRAAILSAILVESVLTFYSSPLVTTIYKSAAALTPTITWTGSAGDGLWSNTANWSPNRLPTSTDIIEIDGNNALTSTVQLDIDFTLDASGTLAID